MPSNPIPNIRPRGITVVEILIVIAVFLILVSFAVPAVSVSTAKTDLITATEQFELSVRTARNTARSTETPVTLEIEAGSESEGATLHFRVQPSGNRALQQLAHRVEQLDADIYIESAQNTFVFDSRGMLAEPGEITLASRDDSSLSETLVIR